MKIESYENPTLEDSEGDWIQECHECPVNVNPNRVTMIWLSHLCQHYIALCDRHLDEMIKALQGKELKT